jgi:CRP-like cAMP-binding protein
MALSAELETLIARSRWSRELSAAQLARIREDAFERTYPAGAVVRHRGTPADHWIGVIEGMVKVDTVSRDGRPTTFAGVPAGAWFGEGAVLRSEPRPYSVVAVRDSRLAFVPRSTFEWLLEHSHTFSRFVIDQLNVRCGYYVGLLETFRLNDAAERVAFCLAELFNPQLYPATGPTLELSQEEIGRLSGLSRQNTNRALHELARAGLLSINYGSVRVLDLDGLRRFARESSP